MKYTIVLAMLILGCEQAPTLRPSLVFLGDSMTEHHDWSVDFPQFDTTAIANGGRQSSGVLQYIDRLSGVRFDAAFLMIGINDVSQGIPESTTLQNVREVLTRIRAYQPNAVIYLQSVLPLAPALSSSIEGVAFNSRTESLNRAYRALADDFGARYVDLYPLFVGHPEYYVPDGIHLTRAGYDAWINALK